MSRPAHYTDQNTAMAELRAGWSDPAKMSAFANEPLRPELQRKCNLQDDAIGQRFVINHPAMHEVLGFVNGDVNRRFTVAVQMLREAYRARNWPRWVFSHPRPYRAECLNSLLRAGWFDGPEDADFGELASAIWGDSENIYQNQLAWNEMTDCVYGTHWMDEEEREALDAMPDTITVWRGLGVRTPDDGIGIVSSWTTDKEKAIWFADRWSNEEPGRLLVIDDLPKSGVWAHLMGHGESEVIIRDALQFNVAEEQR